MTTLRDLVPDVQTLIALEAPELAGTILRHLSSLRSEEKQLLHLGNYTGTLRSSHLTRYPEQYWSELSVCIAEAWAWLLAHGLLAPRPDRGQHGWVLITRLGRKAAEAAEFADCRKSLELPKERLHPAIAERCFGHFIRGLFDTAVFEVT